MAMVEPRAVRWHSRFNIERPDHLKLLISEVGDDLDDTDKLLEEFKSEVAKVKGILFGILVSTTTGMILLAANLFTGQL